MYFVITLLILFISLILLIFLRSKETEIKSLIYLFAIIFACGLFFLPFFDIFVLSGFLASVLLQNSFFTIYGAIIGLIVIEFGIYGIHIFLSSVNLIREERYKQRFVSIKQFSKKRFPIIASYHLIGLSYVILMGSITGVVILSIMMIFLSYDTSKIEEKILIPKFGEKYLKYQKIVPKRIYSTELVIILTLEYILFLIAILIFYFKYTF